MENQSKIMPLQAHQLRYGLADVYGVATLPECPSCSIQDDDEFISFLASLQAEDDLQEAAELSTMAAVDCSAPAASPPPLLAAPASLHHKVPTYETCLLTPFRPARYRQHALSLYEAGCRFRSAM
jgi:hypothetical protein